MVWAVIVSVILLMIIYAWVSSKITNYRRRKNRQRNIPTLEDQIRTGVRYNLVLNSGAKLENVEILGLSSPEEGSFSFWGYENTLVLARQNGKKVYVKSASIKFAEEI